MRKSSSASAPTAGFDSHEHGTALGEHELSIRSARKEGRQVVTLRCVETNGEYVVDTEVYPVSGLRVDPLRPGPYRFPSLLQANAFVDEAMRALTFLGCETA